MKNILFNDISLAPLCKAHLAELAPRLRAADRAEMWAAYRLQVREGLELCLGRSVLAVAFVYRGKAAAAAGVEAQSLLGRRGCVWSWTGDSVDGCAKSFFRASCAALAARTSSATLCTMSAPCSTAYRYPKSTAAPCPPFSL